MTALQVNAELAEPDLDAGPARLFWLDTFNSTRRFVFRGMRQPDVVLGGVIMPIVFVVLFGYVFGSSITVDGGNYHQYLMSGLFAQSALFSSASVAVAVATDMSEGVIDRFRVMPITRSALLLGRTLSTMIIGLPSMLVMICCALAVGWRPQAGVLHAVLGFLLLQLFSFAMGWVGALVGMYASGPQAADALAMIPTFILGFVSNVYVQTDHMPTWLRVFAEWNPMSSVVAAGRTLFGGTPASAGPQPWPLAHPILTTTLVAAALLLTIMPVAVRKYASTDS